jgi:hypothetical protein
MFGKEGLWQMQAWRLDAIRRPRDMQRWRLNGRNATLR